jgi:flagellar hook-basal body complex protein FliE
MSVSGIESVSGLSGLFPGVQATGETAGPTGPTGPNFADLVTNGIEGLEAMNDRTDRLAVGAATGDLGAIHDYTIAATETSVATQLTVAVRNKAVEAFNEIMRMQV